MNSVLMKIKLINSSSMDKLTMKKSEKINTVRTSPSLKEINMLKLPICNLNNLNNDC